MMVRNYIQAQTSFPDEEPDEVIINHGDRNIAEAIAQMLEGVGCVAKPVEGAGDHGYSFFFKYQKREFYCAVSGRPEYCIIDVNGPKRFFGAPHPVWGELLLLLDAALREDPRFERFVWSTDQDFRQGRFIGSDSPMVS